MKNIGKWLYLIGLAVAILASLFGFSADWLTWILMLVGVLAGIFAADTDDLTNFAIRYLALFAVASALDGFIFVGPYITAIFTAVVGFLGPVLLTTLVIWFIKKEFGKK